MDIGSLSYRQLQEECRKANLSAGGTATVLRRRLGQKRAKSLTEKDSQEDQQPPKKRVNAISDDLICPITHELPFEPVVAEDGRVYERLAIEQHFSSHPDVVKSPITNEPIGRRLFPSPQIKSLIENLIETRAIKGELRDTWMKKVNEQKWRKALLKKAQDGNAEAMFELYGYYGQGKNGFEKNHKRAFYWVQKAHESGSVRATAIFGYYRLEGCCGDHVVDKNTSQGLVCLSLAAERGSNFAAYILGQAFRRGMYGLPIDKKQAIRWLEKCLDEGLAHRHMVDSDRAKAKADLQRCVDVLRAEPEGARNDGSGESE